jgi:undecaprenyl-diphosphatase
MMNPASDSSGTRARRTVSTRTVAALLLCAAVSAAALSALMCAGLTKGLDNAAYAFASGLMSGGMTAVMKALTVMGSEPVLTSLAAVIILIIALRRKDRLYLILADASLGAAALISLMMKLGFHRARPSVLRLAAVHGYSFPSGHSMLSVAFYGYLAYMCLELAGKGGRAAAAGLWALTLLVAFSRIYLGAHYASDVLCGLLAGACILCTAILITRRTGTSHTAGAHEDRE